LRLSQEGYFIYVTYFMDKSGGQDTLRKIKSIGGDGKLLNVDVSNEKSELI